MKIEKRSRETVVCQQSDLDSSCTVTRHEDLVEGQSVTTVGLEIEVDPSAERHRDPGRAGGDLRLCCRRFEMESDPVPSHCQAPSAACPGCSYGGVAVAISKSQPICTLSRGICWNMDSVDLGLRCQDEGLQGDAVQGRTDLLHWSSLKGEREAPNLEVELPGRGQEEMQLRDLAGAPDKGCPSRALVPGPPGAQKGSGFHRSEIQKSGFEMNVCGGETLREIEAGLESIRALAG